MDINELQELIDKAESGVRSFKNEANWPERNRGLALHIGMALDPMMKTLEGLLAEVRKLKGE